MANKNGHDDEPPDNKVTRFPDSRERAELERRLKAANDQAPPEAAEPMLNLPPAIKALSLVLILIQVGMWALTDEHSPLHNDDTANWIVLNFGFLILRYTGGLPFGWQGVVSPVSHMFLHGGWLHLAVNVATLAAFGAGLERRIGWRKLSLLYFGSGVIGAFTHAALYLAYIAVGGAAAFPHPEAPLIGASGGISGLFGAVLMMVQGGATGSLRKMAPIVLLWIGISLFFGVFGMPGQDSPIAWTTHVGGFLAGLLLYRPLLRSKIRE